MFTNYFKTAFRNIRKNKLQSLVNLLSLFIGITCCMLIYSHIKYELSYDRFLKKYDQIFRLEHKINSGDQLNTRYANINQYVNPGKLNSISSIINQTRFAILPTIYLETNNKKIAETDIWVADSSFFSIFSHPFIKGNKRTALDQPNSIVITRETANKYFSSEDVVGKSITVTFQKASIDATITGIIENVPLNSHLQFDGIASSSLTQGLFQRNLSQAYLGYNYLLLKKGQSVNEIEKQLAGLSKETNQQAIDFRLMPMADIHLYSDARGEISTNSDIRYIYSFIAIGIIILIVAGINFTNLATAQALQRYKEAGIRKVLGSSKYQLIAQFLFEAIFLSLIALAAGFLIIYLILPYFNILTGTPFTFSYFLTPSLVLSAVATSLLIGLFAGIYPAVLLSVFQPVKTLKGITPSGKKGASVWKSITVIQFAASITMIICTAIIYKQLSYIQTRNLGFEKERIVTVYNPVGTKYAPLKSRLENLSGVKNVSLSSYIPGVSKTGGTAQILTKNNDTLRFNWISVDYNYLDTYGIEIKKGRKFSKSFGTDSTQAFILNETAVKALGMNSPIGKQIEAFSRKGTIIGVARNFNYLSLHRDFTPVVFLIEKSLYFNFSIRLNQSADISETMAQIQNAWEKQLPDTPFEYDFVDDKFNALYKADRQMGTSFAILASLALVVACLGLFSLSSFMASKKRKEVGIRKVHGASISDILFSFYTTYGKLIIMASIIAVPTSFYFLKQWLQNFAFKTEISGLVFVFAVLATLIIAIATVSYESVKAAFSNPVESIRSE